MFGATCLGRTKNPRFLNRDATPPAAARVDRPERQGYAPAPPEREPHMSPKRASHLDAETLAALRQKLLDMRAELLRSSGDLAEEALKKSGQDFSVDHMADHGSDNAEQAISISLLEGETELLQTIEKALAKLDGAALPAYGKCEQCVEEGVEEGVEGAPWIPAGRLNVVPYATLCIPHKEAQEAGGDAGAAPAGEGA